MAWPAPKVNFKDQEQWIDCSNEIKEYVQNLIVYIGASYLSVGDVSQELWLLWNRSDISTCFSLPSDKSQVLQIISISLLLLDTTYPIKSLVRNTVLSTIKTVYGIDSYKSNLPYLYFPLASSSLVYSR